MEKSEYWDYIFDSAFKMLVSTVGPENFATDIVIEAVKYVIATNRKLDIINEKVDAIVQGPFNTGLLHLEDVSKQDRTTDERIASIGKAKDYFYEAYGKELREPKRKALIAFKIGTCYAFLKKRNDTLYWYEKAYNSAEDVESEYLKQFKKTFWDSNQILEELEDHYKFMRPLAKNLIKLESKMDIKKPEDMDTSHLFDSDEDGDDDKYQQGDDWISTSGRIWNI